MSRCLSERALLLERPPSASLARENASLMDGLLASLATEAAASFDPGKPWALVALGGYGAGRLLPYSDIDLLVASEASPERLMPFVSAILYPLWDAGLAVGHTVRGKRDALAAAADDAANLTAMLTARAVAGADDVAASVLGSVAERARRKPYSRGGALTALAARSRPGSPYELWPDLKEGRGGQRDLDELAWTAAVTAGTPGAGFSVLVEAGLLEPAEAARLDESQDLVTAARWVTHIAHGRGDNRFDEDAAPRLPFDAEVLQSALIDVDATLTRARARTADAAPRSRFSPPAPVVDRAPADAGGVLAALAQGPARLEDAQSAAWDGALEFAVPGWRDLMALRRPSLSHRLTVGAHSMAAAALVRSVCDEDPRAAAVVAGGGDFSLLVVAALLHDVGKRSDSRDHGAAGADVAAAAATRLGFDDDAARTVASLVRHHLVLAETAGNLDIDDEDVVLELASRLIDPQLPGELYVLTEVDSLATGPDVWTPWKAALIGELAGKAERVLRGGDVTELARQAGVVRAEVMALAGTGPEGTQVAEFARYAPLRYLAEHTAREVADQARLAYSLAEGGRHAAAGLEIRAGSLRDTWLVTIVAVDRPGLLALLTGVLALSGLDILAVSAHTTSRGVAFDTLTVTSATLAQVDPSTWARLERLLDAALAGQLAVPTRLAERRSHYRSAERTVKPKAKSVTGDFTTALTVRATDRVGLLHDLALALSRAGLDIRSVTALTSGGVARDTFRVVDEYGEPPVHPAVLDAAKKALLRAAEGNPPREDPPEEEST